MSLVKERVVSWGASPSPDVAGYKVYYKKGGSPTYSDPSVSVGKNLSITLPSGLTGAIAWYGDYTLGISCVDTVGNESDMSYGSRFFDFVAPDAPGLVLIG